MRERIALVLPTGFLKIGKPLIYGASLPIFYSFITECPGTGFSGAALVVAKNAG